MSSSTVQYTLEGQDSVEVAVGRDDHASQGNYAAEQQLWKHEFFRECLAPKVANFKVWSCYMLHAH